MSLRVIPPPSQGGETLEFSVLMVEADTALDLQTAINALSVSNRERRTPAGESFISDIQYQAVNAGGNMIKYSAMIVIGQWNPT